MNQTKSLTGRSIRQIAAWLSAPAMALGLATLGLVGVVSAQAATASPVAPASTPAPIPLNMLNWSGHACCKSRPPTGGR